mmetsp:Transcript_70690/g.199548  ORF Transcript_70690/g.199548 Transcript_70690/m.199548 type:complete len:212 (+) Transcript_70690:913-1548(+)
MPARTNPGWAADVRFILSMKAGSKLSDAGVGLGISGPSPVSILTSSSSCFFFSIHSLMRSTALECRRRRPDKSRMASKFVVFLPRPCFRNKAPKPPLPPSKRKRTRMKHGCPKLRALRKAGTVSSSSSRSLSWKRTRMSVSASQPNAEQSSSRSLSPTSSTSHDSSSSGNGTNFGFSFGTRTMTPGAMEPMGNRGLLARVATNTPRTLERT